MRASQDKRYEDAVENYAKAVPHQAAPRTFESGVAWGLLAGTCIVLGLDPMGEAVREDVQSLRAILYAPIAGRLSVQTPEGWDKWQSRLEQFEKRRA